MPVWFAFFVVPGMDDYLYLRVLGESKGGGRFGLFNRIKCKSKGRVFPKI